MNDTFARAGLAAGQVASAGTPDGCARNNSRSDQ
jgi:hypothetical protein